MRFQIQSIGLLSLAITASALPAPNLVARAAAVVSSILAPVLSPVASHVSGTAAATGGKLSATATLAGREPVLVSPVTSVLGAVVTPVATHASGALAVTGGKASGSASLEVRDPLVSTVTSILGAVVTPITGTVGKAVGSVPALAMASCKAGFQNCTLTVSGEIENILTDGGNFTGQASVSAWMQQGHGYGSAKLAGTAPLPFNITCNATANVCEGTVSGNITQTFSNGMQIVGWAWLTPAGHCSNGTCVGSITTTGDPSY